MEASHVVAVHCRGLTKSYGTGDTQVHALRGIDLDIYYGQLLMLVGPSGSGKTTLISIIAGILDRDGGQCLVLDKDLQPVDPAERAHFRGVSIGLVFQTFNLLPSLTAAENVAIPLLIHGMSRKNGHRGGAISQQALSALPSNRRRRCHVYGRAGVTRRSGDD